MIDKKILFSALLCVLFLYTTIDQWLDKKNAQKEARILTDKILQLEQSIEKNNQLVTNNEQEKVKLENQSQERQEQMNEQLKDNDCANRFVPMPVSASLYNRAKNLRESTDTSQSIK
ncbi:hypothetical protein A9G11_03545 [Gilliamella sp. wkB108]|uniref:DUF2570 domain-containing protein n=1 Tax=Gilliamella sp. wkB108 TaxID=3120256 RepID=UPI00080E6FD6|nr:DUF2570 domain-containing protein [Gilliamella apicola]OCG24741.1 hypothetical protein A9G11_03545 [Gilliamella apicola]